jgi:prophage tail gpP-like protein
MNAKKTDAAEIALVPPVFGGLLIEAQTQRAKSQEELKKREREWGKQTSDCMRQNHEGGVLESFGAAAGKLVFGALSKTTEDARKALDSAWPCGTPPAK